MNPQKPTPHPPSTRTLRPLGADEDPLHLFTAETSRKATTATRLFRNEELFRAVAEAAGSASARKGLTIWCAGCSSGEEAYSLAVAAHAAFEAAGGGRLLIYGTDINTELLARARAGVYASRWQDLHARWKQRLSRYADLHDDGLVFHDWLKRLMKFGIFDVRQRPKRHTFDFISCNHVLQYYDADGQRQIAENLLSVLRPGGHIYLEGVTPVMVDKLNLQRLPGWRNLYRP